MSQTIVASDSAGEPPVCSPPLSERPASPPTDTRAQLHELARQLRRAANRAMMLEYLRLRREVGGT